MASKVSKLSSSKRFKKHKSNENDEINSNSEFSSSKNYTTSAFPQLTISEENNKNTVITCQDLPKKGGIRY
jgi:hypothetical protein